MSHGATQKYAIAFIFVVWTLILSCHLMKGSLACFVLGNFNGQKLKENEKLKNDTVTEFLRSDTEEDSSDAGQDTNSRSCKYLNRNKRLICRGSVDYDYLKTVRDELINDFIVDGYGAEFASERKYWSPNELQAGDWYLKLPKTHQRLAGKVHLKDTGLHVDVNLRMLPNRDLEGFWIEGEAFSNKVIKISWRLKGNLSLNFIRNRTTISLDVGVVGNDDWTLRSNLTFLESQKIENEAGEWGVNGIVKSTHSSGNQVVFFKGIVATTVKPKEGCQFLGLLKMQNANLEASVSGHVSPTEKKRITIPRSAFSNMTINNIVFRDSNFYNDLDKYSFEGLSTPKRISFVRSNLEIFPRLDELFQDFSSLEEIYIEYCTTPQFKFGTKATLEQVRRLSFKGSGPLTFDDSSFLWLQNSRLTFLNLRNSHVKISSRATSILWSVNKTLRHLDISYSSLKEERDLNLVLKNLNIITLKAEGLKLSRIPTSALENVRKSLMYLSLRENDFRKNLEKLMFQAILNFPLMLNLRELNLEECHLNYIEKGTFDNLPNLKTLHLGFNNIENIQDGWTYIAPKVTYLGLSHNEFTPQSHFGLHDKGTSMNLSRFRELENLDLSDGMFREINKLVGSLGRGLRNLSLRNTRLGDLPDNFFDNLSDLEVLDLSHNRNMKAGHPFSFNTFKNLKKLKSLDLNHCRITVAVFDQNNLTENKNSDKFTLENLEYLDLSVNNFKILDFKTLKAFPNLKMLNLSGNSITEWNTRMFSSEHLETLFLDENKIETITNEMLSDIGRLKHVRLGHNPFVCGSYVYEIIQMVQEVAKNQSRYLPREINGFTESEVEAQEADFMENFFKKIKPDQMSNGGNVKFLDWSENNYICYSRHHGKFIPFAQVNEDFPDSSEEKKNGEGVRTALLWWTSIIVVGVVISGAIVCWKFLDIHLITRAVRSAVALSFIGGSEKGLANFKYNVFVSYCDKDRAWVVGNLLPRLESRGQEQTVCLHERDFQVGMSIIENILNSIESSRNIILVVSQAFLKSQWCQYEMQLAQFRLLEKGRHQLILIFLENIPAIKRPKTLRYLMMTKTYLEWPLNPKSHKDINTFWSRLMKSLENTN